MARAATQQGATHVIGIVRVFNLDEPSGHEALPMGPKLNISGEYHAARSCHGGQLRQRGPVDAR